MSTHPTNKKVYRHISLSGIYAIQMSVIFNFLTQKKIEFLSMSKNEDLGEL